MNHLPPTQDSFASAQLASEDAVNKQTEAEKSGAAPKGAANDVGSEPEKDNTPRPFSVSPSFSSQTQNQASRLDYQEFERLFRAWKKSGDPALRERMILMHRNLVTFLARRFVDRGDLYEDVVQVGFLGLINAIDAFDIDRGLRFSTFAMPTISGEMRHYFRDKVSGMKVPRRLQELYLTIHPHVEEMTHRLNRSPTYAEIAFELKIEVEEVVEALELGSALDPSSLDDFQFHNAEGGSVADSLGALDPDLAAYEEHTSLQAALEKLSPKERIVLEMAYFEGHSQVEIARRLNVSQMHISRLLRKSLAQLRKFLEEV